MSFGIWPMKKSWLKSTMTSRRISSSGWNSVIISFGHYSIISYKNISSEQQKNRVKSHALTPSRLFSWWFFSAAENTWLDRISWCTLPDPHRSLHGTKSSTIVRSPRQSQNRLSRRFRNHRWDSSDGFLHRSKLMFFSIAWTSSSVERQWSFAEDDRWVQWPTNRGGSVRVKSGPHWDSHGSFQNFSKRCNKSRRWWITVFQMKLNTDLGTIDALPTKTRMPISQSSSKCQRSISHRGVPVSCLRTRSNASSGEYRVIYWWTKFDRRIFFEFSSWSNVQTHGNRCRQQTAR